MKNSYWTDKTELPTIEWNGYRNYLPAAVPSGNITDFQGNGGVSMAKLRRTLAWVIGGDDAKLQQVLASEADAITIELEDLCPAEAKESARAWAVDKLQHVDFGEKEVGVRINSFESPWAVRIWRQFCHAIRTSFVCRSVKIRVMYSTSMLSLRSMN